MPGRRGHCPVCRSRQCRQDPAQCRLVDRAGQAPLHPRGQLDFDYPIHPPIGFGGRRHRLNRRCGQCKLFNRRHQSHWRKPSQLARAKLPPPGVKLAAADPVQPAYQSGRGSRRHTLCQYPQLLFEAPAPPPLRAAENLAADLASPRMSTPEVLLIDQPHIIHCIAAAKTVAASQSATPAQDANRQTLTGQALSAKLGIVTGQNLAELCREQLPRPVALAMWGISEIAAMATDLAEFLGGAIGLSLLFKIPLLPGMIITAVVVYGLLLQLQRNGFRPIELLIGSLVATIGVCYLIELFLMPVEWSSVAFHSVVPQLGGPEALTLAVGIV